MHIHFLKQESQEDKKNKFHSIFKNILRTSAGDESV